MKLNKNFRDTLDILSTEIDKRLDALLPENEGRIYLLHEAMRYSVFAGGKRIRPILLLLTYNMFDNNIDNAIDFACAIEMIHTYSLIHDDLPCMDDDDLRRGKPTSHKVYGEAEALLCGDALLNFAVEVMLNCANKHEENAIIYIKAMKEILSSTGIGGMIGGQFVDIKNENVPVDEVTLNYINRNKTAALITASLKAGAILGKATGDQLSKIAVYGDNLGIAFQIQDDILDVCGDQSKLGKPIGSDEKNLKTTYVTLVGLNEAQNRVHALMEDAIKSIQGIDNSELLVELIDFLIKRQY